MPLQCTVQTCEKNLLIYLTSLREYWYLRSNTAQSAQVCVEDDSEAGGVVGGVVTTVGGVAEALGGVLTALDDVL